RIRTAESYRMVYTNYQRDLLEMEYRSKEFIDKKDRERIAGQTGLDDSQIKYWFQNRRVRDKRKNKR
ncbi:hypothetical protein HELRODRAFT_148126, partial [Helobdella robusta]|uniref:Homeobox domain-containing protein n=1 Tax=Helobdella robusta TaxID=6412 RepID=T1EK52_HELRO